MRWDASGTAATELGNLGTDSSGYTNAKPTPSTTPARPWDACEKYVGGSYKGAPCRALGRLGHGRHRTGQPGHRQQRLTYADAYAVNDAGTAVGYATKYVGGSYKGTAPCVGTPRARPPPNLGNLGTDSSGVTDA